MIKKAKTKIWTLTRLKGVGASRSTLLETYIMRIRTHLVYCTPVWSGALTVYDSNRLESVQKLACYIIIGSHMYTNYKEALEILEIDSLSERREKVCLTFAKKTVKNERFAYLFPKKLGLTTRNMTFQPFIEPVSRTTRYFKSPLQYLRRLLNSNEKESQNHTNNKQ